MTGLVVEVQRAVDGTLPTVTLDGDALRTVTVWAVDGLTIAILGSLAWDDVSGVAVELLTVVVLAVGATGDDELDDGRTVAQVLVAQMEFADVVVLSDPHPDTLAVARRLAPKARIRNSSASR